MKDEIKEILDDLRKIADNTIFVVCSSQEELDKMPRYTANFMSINDRKAKLLLDYITNSQKEKDYYFKKNNELSTLNTSLRNDRDIYKTRIDKTIEYIEYQISQLDFEKDTKAKMLGCMILVLLQGSDE